MLLFYHVATHIRNESLRDAYAFLSLEVFEDRSNDTRESESRTVECVAKFSLLGLAVAEAALESVSLVSVEITNRRNFEPALLSLRVNLEVVADSRSEALVTTTEKEDTVRQFQLLEQAFHVVEHLLVRSLRVLRLVDAHQFNLRELMQTVETTHVLAVRKYKDFLDYCERLIGKPIYDFDKDPDKPFMIQESRANSLS